MASEEREPVPQEIERKYKVESVPFELKGFLREEISQGYLSINDEDGSEERIRKEGDEYIRTIKGAGDEIRPEINTPISKEEFDRLWPQTEGQRIFKTRYYIPFGSHVVELDIYRNELEGLMTAEVEFVILQISSEFDAPGWMGTEVTKDSRYKNKNLARYGLPENFQQKSEGGIFIPTYEKEEGLSELITKVENAKSRKDGPVIVAIAGGSASGKTSAIASRVVERFGEDALLLSMDDYSRGNQFLEDQARQGNKLNWDHPDYIDIELLQQHLEQLQKGHAIDKPIYSFVTGEREGTEEVKPKGIIVIEGLFALDGRIANLADVNTFVEIGTHGQIIRRLLRDIHRTEQKPTDILRYFAETVEPMHRDFVEPTKDNAHFIIRNEYKAKEEAERSEIHELQLKFRKRLNEEFLRQIGAERLASVYQTDYYYHPHDRDLSKTGEILRIREEGSEQILTYKGPLLESNFRKRAKLEFPIDRDTEKIFLEMYGTQIKIINKTRTIYQVGGIVFSQDHVEKHENGQNVLLGNFIELRMTDQQEVSANLIEQFMDKLGLDGDSIIKQSYYDM